MKANAASCTSRVKRYVINIGRCRRLERGQNKPAGQRKIKNQE